MKITTPLYEVSVWVGQRRELLMTTPHPDRALYVAQALRLPGHGIEVADDNGNALSDDDLVLLCEGKP